MTRTIRPFFGYFGGKWRDALRNYAPPRYGIVVEPFAGAAGYSLRYYTRQVVLCEKDEVIAGVWQYLIKVKASEIRAIPDLPPDGTVDDLKVCQEAQWLVGLWLNRAASRPRRSPSRWMRDGIRPGSFWGERVRNTIASQVDLIRHWQIHHGDYSRVPVVGPATWFIDPPYQQAGRHYYHGSADINYAQLAAWCRGRTGQVIVCENAGATWLPFVPLSDVKTTRAGRRSIEVVWQKDDDPAVHSKTAA